MWLVGEPRFTFIQFEDLEVNEGMDMYTYIYIFVIFLVPHTESWDEQQQTATTMNKQQLYCFAQNLGPRCFLVLRYLSGAPLMAKTSN